MPKDEVPNHNCIKHLRSVVQQQQTKIADLEKTAAEHKHQLAEQVRPKHCCYLLSPNHRGKPLKALLSLSVRFLSLSLLNTHTHAHTR